MGTKVGKGCLRFVKSNAVGQDLDDRISNVVTAVWRAELSADVEGAGNRLIPLEGCLGKDSPLLGKVEHERRCVEIGLRCCDVVNAVLDGDCYRDRLVNT